MTAYGILLVDTSWTNHDTAEIDKAAFLRHKDRLVEGTKALIYMREPIDAVIAEAEVTSEVIETETTPPDSPFNPAIPASVRSEHVIGRIESETEPPPAMTDSREIAHSFRVPLKVVRLKGQTPEIGFNRLQAILGSDFSVYDETWIPLSAAQYEAITALWREARVP